MKDFASIPTIKKWLQISYMTESELERRDWAKIEVEATVSDYLEMLLLELRNEKYNKAQHRRLLLQLLNDRSDPAVERKHRNISAILIEMGLPYIQGYKPLQNYQALLQNVVQERIPHTLALVSTVQAETERVPLSVPDVDNILHLMVDPPVSKERPIVPETEERPYVPHTFRTNFLMLEAQNAHLGRAGEEFVINFEHARLISEGKGNLAGRIEHVSITKGDQEGYDVLSFSTDGYERLIEVKTIGFGIYTPFFVTRNELKTSKEKAGRYHVYRVFNFHRAPRVFTLPRVINQSCNLEPTLFIAQVCKIH